MTTPQQNADSTPDASSAAGNGKITKLKTAVPLERTAEKKAAPLKVATPDGTSAKTAKSTQSSPEARSHDAVPVNVAAKATSVEPPTPIKLPLESVRPSGSNAATDKKTLRTARALQQTTPTAKKPKAGSLPVVATQPKGETDDEADDEQSDSPWRRMYTCWAASLVVHLVLLFVLALWAIQDSVVQNQMFVVVSDIQEMLDEEEIETEFETKEIEDLIPEPDEQVNELAFEADSIVLDDTLSGAEQSDAELPTDLTKTPDFLASGDLMFELPESDAGKISAGATGVGKQRGQGKGEGFDGAGTGLGGRAGRRKEMGEISKSEPVVQAGLVWLARHQMPDGSWSYRHGAGGNCNNQCPDPGHLANARFAATGMALLPFLGGGDTHEEGKFQKQVAAGLAFMMKNMGKDRSLWDVQGRMYGQGIATLALCEAYGTAAQSSGSLSDADPNKKVKLLDNNKLRIAAKRAADFVNAAQGPGGGWRYKPGEVGDTSVLGWQIMALKSAKDAGLTSNKTVRKKALAYLSNCDADRVGDEHYGYYGTKYAYMRHRIRFTPATNAIGMLSRIYMGLSVHHPAAETVVRRLAEKGHSNTDMYFNYYATQIMYQHGGEAWENWKDGITSFLIDSQARGGHENGSWMMPKRGGDEGVKQGGRLYCTTMALLCLEEHYRHLRISENAGGNVSKGGKSVWGRELSKAKGEAAPPAKDPEPADKPDAEAKADAEAAENVKAEADAKADDDAKAEPAEPEFPLE